MADHRQEGDLCHTCTPPNSLPLDAPSGALTDRRLEETRRCPALHRWAAAHSRYFITFSQEDCHSPAPPIGSPHTAHLALAALSSRSYSG